jgi:EpsI family protein
MLQNALPRQIHHKEEEWIGNDLPVDRQTALVLETEDIIQRRYFDPRSSKFVDFCIIYSEDNRKGTHPPDLCLEGGGMNIMFKNDIHVSGISGQDVIPCREIIVQSGQEYTYFLYTYKCGTRYTASFWLQQLIIFSNGLFNRNSSGALIRVSTPMNNGPEEAQARERAKDFLRIGIPYLNRVLP